MNKNKDGSVSPESVSNVCFFLGSFGILAAVVGSGFIVAAATI
jgi:hypothetical protein